jgi:hypothetical protein
MAYQIDRYNNTLLTSVEDGTIDQTTDLKFIGKNYAGYGEIQNENFLFLLENFSGANQPSRPISGQNWFDSGASKMKFYDGTQWRTSGGAEVSATEPSGLAEGDFWWDNQNEQLYAQGSSGFVLVGPQTAGEGVTQMQSLSVQDLSGTAKIIIAATIEDTIVYVISPDEFTLNAVTPLEGFDRIKKGLTLKWTKAADNGVTNSASVSGQDFYYWGTASNSEKLGGLPASSFVQVSSGSNTVFNEAVEFPDSGVLVGDSQDFQLIVENGDEGVIQNISGTNSIVKVKVTDGTGSLTHMATFNINGLIPAADNTFDIGSSSLAWKNIHAYSFVGEATKATSVRVGTDFRTASVSASNNTVAVRDATGNLAANLFQGTATQARYADLAEKYTTESEYAVGTVVAVCAHEEHEMALATPASIVSGVISDKPAYLMNAEAEGQAIALVGRVPVRVTGPVNKGDAVKVFADGIASVDGLGDMVGVALESNSDEAEKLVECILKV